MNTYQQYLENQILFRSKFKHTIIPICYELLHSLPLKKSSVYQNLFQNNEIYPVIEKLIPTLCSFLVSKNKIYAFESPQALILYTFQIIKYWVIVLLRPPYVDLWQRDTFQFTEYLTDMVVETIGCCWNQTENKFDPLEMQPQTSESNITKGPPNISDEINQILGNQPRINNFITSNHSEIKSRKSSTDTNKHSNVLNLRYSKKYSENINPKLQKKINSLKASKIASIPRAPTSAPTEGVLNKYNIKLAPGIQVDSKYLKEGHENRSDHRSEHRSDHRSEHRSDHRSDHRSEHRSEHRSDHRSEHRSEHRSDHRSELTDASDNNSSNTSKHRTRSLDIPEIYVESIHSEKLHGNKSS